MKNYSLLLVTVFSLLTFFACTEKNSIIDVVDTIDEDETQVSVIIPVEAPIPPATIRTEACYTPEALTLIVAHKDRGNFYFEDNASYRIDWYKDKVFLQSAPRIDCATDGYYQAIIISLEDKAQKELIYELSTQNDQ